MLRFYAATRAYGGGAGASGVGVAFAVARSSSRSAAASAASTLSRFFSSSALSTLPSHQQRLARIRNIGIIAHIDAGKTTTAERVLFYSRRTRILGDVDRGDTVLDFMREERERGITIQAACITLPWSRVGPAADGVEHRLNLIDTPGHVDFTQQVEQSLRVLDGAICVLDGVKGVEAQTVCVWQQAATYGVARIAFVNKMDRDGASLTRVVETMREKLHTTPLVVTLPLFSDASATGGDGMRAGFVGVIDLVRMEAWEWGTSPAGQVSSNNLSGQADDGSKFTVTPLPPSHPSYTEALRARGELLERVSEADDRLMELYMDVVGGDETDHLAIPSNEIIQALRRITVASSAAPTSTTTTRDDAGEDASSTTSAASEVVPQPYTIVMCGSSKSNKGVQYLLNAVLDFLPSPLDKQHVAVEEIARAAAPSSGSKKGAGNSSTASDAPLATRSVLRPVGGDPSKEPVLALAFKVTHDLARGAMPIVFVRVYTGTLKKGDALVSLAPPPVTSDWSTRPKERPQKLLEISADSLSLELDSLEAGNIGALVGVKSARAGDTMLASSVVTSATHASSATRPAVLGGIARAEPVFFCSVEAGSLSAARALDQALVCLQREDPSLHVSIDADSGQTVLAGMGELHLDIIRSRLERDFALGSSEGGAGVEFGAMRISYREGLQASVEASFKHVPSATTGDMVEASVKVHLEPNEEEGSGLEININLPQGLSTTSPNTQTLLNAARSGAKDAMARGPLLGYPMTDVTVTVSDLSFIGPPTNAVAQSIRACAARAVGAALRQARGDGVVHLLEPVMSCELALSSAHLGDVLSDLTSKRRGQVLDVRHVASATGSASTSRSDVEAEVPLAAMLGYASVLRSTTQGGGTFSMSFRQFRAVPPHIQTQLLESPP